MKVPDWISKKEFSFTFKNTDIVKPLLPYKRNCELAKVGLKSDHTDEILYLCVGEGVIKGKDKYICINICYIITSKATKLKFVKILGLYSQYSFYNIIEPLQDGDTAKGSSTEPRFEKKSQELTASTLSELNVEISDKEREAVNTWLKEAQTKKYPEGIEAAIDWLSNKEWSQESRMTYLEQKIEQAMQDWKTGEEAISQKPIKDEAYQREKKTFLDFLHDLHYNPAPIPKVESSREVRNCKQTKHYQDEQEPVNKRK
jgi:hypothetical protein